MNTIELVELEEKFTRLSDKALVQFARPYICMTLHDIGSETAEQASGVLDIIYSECVDREIEKLYDMTYESVSKHPELCQAA